MCFRIGDVYALSFLSMIGVLLVQCLFFAVTVETMLSGVTELPFTVFLAAMQPIHLAIGFVEGLITAAVLCFIYVARPEMLWGVENAAPREAKLSYGKTFTILGILAAVVGGVLSLFASALPDGLEWAMERVAGTSELVAEGGAYEAAETVQSALSFLPGCTFKGSESAAGTTVSGLVGAAIVAQLCIGFSMAF